MNKQKPHNSRNKVDSIYEKFFNDINDIVKNYNLKNYFVTYSTLLSSVLFNGDNSKNHKAALLGRLLYWSDKSEAYGIDKNTFYKTKSELAEESGISNHAVAEYLDEFTERSYIEMSEGKFKKRKALKITVHPEKILNDFKSRVLTMVGDLGITNIVDEVLSKLYKPRGAPVGIPLDSNGNYIYSENFKTLLKHEFFRRVVHKEDGTYVPLSESVLRGFEKLGAELIKGKDKKLNNNYVYDCAPEIPEDEAIYNILKIIERELDKTKKAYPGKTIDFIIKQAFSTDIATNMVILSMIYHYGPELILAILIARPSDKIKEFFNAYTKPNKAIRGDVSDESDVNEEDVSDNESAESVEQAKTKEAKETDETDATSINQTNQTDLSGVTESKPSKEEIENALKSAASLFDPATKATNAISTPPHTKVDNTSADTSNELPQIPETNIEEFNKAILELAKEDAMLSDEYNESDESDD